MVRRGREGGKEGVSKGGGRERERERGSREREMQTVKDRVRACACVHACVHVCVRVRESACACVRVIEGQKDDVLRATERGRVRGKRERKYV
jgi:hypothetical protein